MTDLHSELEQVTAERDGLLLEREFGGGWSMPGHLQARARRAMVQSEQPNLQSWLSAVALSAIERAEQKDRRLTLEGPEDGCPVCKRPYDDEEEI